MVYRTMQGRVIDIEKLIRENALTPAVGNMRVNARGDEIGPSGQIIRTKEQIAAEYYRTNPKGNKIKADRPKKEEQVYVEPEEEVIDNKRKRGSNESNRNDKTAS